MTQNPKPQTIQAKTEAFFKTVQAGDMTLFQIIQEAIAVFGYTRTGKTTSCHLLCRSPLRALEKDKELIFVPSTQRFDTAVVGVTHESETQIPNIFDTMVKDGNSLKPIIVLDQPGYGDTYGFHRIFSNGYFHYRTFSKTPKLKFVLAVWINDMRGTGQRFKLTIKNFIKTFKNWQSVKRQVLNATCMLVTKADAQTSEASLLGVFKNLRGAVSSMGTKEVSRYQQFVDEMIDKKKVFYILKPTQANQRVQDNLTLQKIYDKTQFWERKVNRNIVDMSQVNFSVAQQILKRLKDRQDQYFRQSYEHYMKYTQERIFSLILDHKGSIRNIVKLLQADSKDKNDSHSFLNAMEQFNHTYDQFLPRYNAKREAITANLFKNIENQQQSQSSQEQLKEIRSIYFIKKFKVLEFLVDTFKNLPDTITTGRSIEELQYFSSIFMQIFKKFSILGINKNDREKIIYKYSYIVQRLIEQSKILTLILFQSDALKNQFQLQDVTISEDIFRLLFDKFFTLVLGQLNIGDLKKEFIKNFDFNDVVVTNDQIITFLESVPLMSHDIQFKLASIIVEFEKKLFQNQSNPEQQKKKYILSKLYSYRNKFYHFWLNLKEGGASQTRQKCSQILIELTKSLANVLQNMTLYNQARQCYKSINDAQSIFKMYELQSNQLSKDPKLYRQLLIKYGHDANIYYRKQLALQCYQKAYALSSKVGQIKKISDCIVKICTEMNQDKQKDPYLSRMYNFDNEFFQDFSEVLTATIQEECNLS